MNYLNRIKNIERSLNPPEMWIGKLLSNDFIYKGKPFDSFDKMTSYFNIKERVSYWETSMLVSLVQKGIMSINSDVGQELLRLARDEVRERI